MIGTKRSLVTSSRDQPLTHILELLAEQAKAANADVNEADLAAIVAEAVQWAREH